MRDEETPEQAYRAALTEHEAAMAFFAMNWAVLLAVEPETETLAMHPSDHERCGAPARLIGPYGALVVEVDSLVPRETLRVGGVRQ
jgi:hypothetical protein